VQKPTDKSAAKKKGKKVDESQQVDEEAVKLVDKMHNAVE
jgi:hypothetical protein